MLKSKPVYWFLRGCAWLLEQLLPVRLYRPLYIRFREFYDVRMLGRPSTVSRSRFDVPMQQGAPEGFPEEPAPEPVDARKTIPTDMAGTRGPFILCDGTEADTPPEETGESCRMVICCAFTGRHHVLEQVIREALHAEGGDAVRFMLTGSTDEDLRFIRAMAVRTGRVAGFVCDNQPLGRKWQTCVRRAYQYFDASLYAITGSDDILSARLIDHVLRAREADAALSEEFAPDLYCANEWLVHSSEARHRPMLLKCGYRYETVFQPLGAGRFYARPFMDAVDGYLFDSSLKRCLDDRGYARIRKAGEKVHFLTVEDGPILSVKGEWEQLNSLDAFFRAPTLNITDYAFPGYRLLRDSLHPDTFRFLFKPTDLGFQLFE